jgi:hypothetical protein
MSYSDNDFYPILYLQHVEKIRKDIRLINYSLLGVDKHIFRATKEQFESPAIKLPIDTNYYQKTTNDVIYIKDSVKLITLDELKSMMMNNLADEFERISINANGIQIKRFDQESNTVDFLTISFNNAKYILKNQWVLFEIIENLDGRAICFPEKLDDPLMTDLNNYLSQKNSLWVLH